MIRAVESPMPGRSVSVPAAARSSSSSGSVVRTTSSARTQAFVLKPVTWARSRQWTIRCRASAGVTRPG